MTRAIVFHGSYGCESGCCGHIVELEDEQGNTLEHTFEMDHPYEEDRATFIRRIVTEAFGEEHVADIAWDDCIVVDD